VDQGWGCGKKIDESDDVQNIIDINK
jgi:hypothetical protein